jgi:hypothetical protein
MWESSSISDYERHCVSPPFSAFPPRAHPAQSLPYFFFLSCRMTTALMTYSTFLLPAYIYALQLAYVQNNTNIHAPPFFIFRKVISRNSDSCAIKPSDTFSPQTLIFSVSTSYTHMRQVINPPSYEKQKTKTNKGSLNPATQVRLTRFRT